jgi:ankyrin repeat protein
VRSEGVNMDVPDSFYRRALHYAAKAGNTEVLARLLSFNVESDPYDNDGNTPIKLAAQHLNFAAIELLKKYRCYTELTTVDYLVGGKNRVASFLYDHTVAVASAAIAATAAICGPFFVTLTNSLLLRGGDLDSADGDDPTLDEVKKNIPQARGLFGQGGPGSGATHVAPLGLAQARKKRVKVEEQAQAPKPAAPQIQQELAAPEVVTTLKRLQAATKALNFARGQHNAVLTDAELNAADALLQELEMLELNSKEREARRHLVAAIRAVVQKFTNPAPLLKIKAMNLFDRYKKYRDKA